MLRVSPQYIPSYGFQYSLQGVLKHHPTVFIPPLLLQGYLLRQNVPSKQGHFAGPLPALSTSTLIVHLSSSFSVFRCKSLVFLKSICHAKSYGSYCQVPPILHFKMNNFNLGLFRFFSVFLPFFQILSVMG